MDHSQVEGAEVFVEWEISEIVVNVKKESVLEVLGRLGVSDPVEFV